MQTQRLRGPFTGDHCIVGVVATDLLHAGGSFHHGSSALSGMGDPRALFSSESGRIWLCRSLVHERMELTISALFFLQGGNQRIKLTSYRTG